MRHLVLAVAAVVIGVPASASAQHAITGPHTIIDFTGYAGTGLVSAPAAGQLSSNAWRVTGMSGGDTAFGGNYPTGDSARGTSAGGVAIGGLYAFTVAPGDPAFGFQPDGTDLTPGAITLRMINQTGAAIVNPVLRWEVWVFNDQARSSSLDLSWQIDAGVVHEAQLAVTSPLAADAVPTWQVTPRQLVLAGTVPGGGLLTLRWTTDDAGGAGADRDELAIDDIELIVGGCGDGVIQIGEGCDDGGVAPGDGCDAGCAVEAGWSCEGQPSSCERTCGNRVIDGDEGCDDGGVTPGDGCDAGCRVEADWDCPDVGEPCVPRCDGESPPAACRTDADGDGVPDDEDNCPFLWNPGQADDDGDGVGNACQRLPPGESTTGCGVGGGGGGLVVVGLVGLVLRRRGRRR